MISSGAASFWHSALTHRLVSRVLVVLLSWLMVPAWAASLQVDVTDGSGRPLAEAAVYLESRDTKRLVKPLPGAEMAQVKKEFLPRVLVVPTGTEVQFPNRDTVRHHVYSFSLIKKFELKLYTGTPANPILFDQPGVAVLGCNIHDLMTAWVVVVDTPFYGRSAETGRVLLDNVPPGSYRLRVWHPAMPVGAPALDQAVTLTSAAQTVAVRLAGLVP